MYQDVTLDNATVNGVTGDGNDGLLNTNSDGSCTINDEVCAEP